MVGNSFDCGLGELKVSPSALRMSSAVLMVTCACSAVILNCPG
jgi:hypothetical protein